MTLKSTAAKTPGKLDPVGSKNRFDVARATIAAHTARARGVDLSRSDT